MSGSALAATLNMGRKNLANVASILGILPIPLLFLPGGYRYVVPVIMFNLIMDDLDGLLARRLSIGSKFGSNLDNVCDVMAHSVFVLLICRELGTEYLVFSAIPVSAVLLRIAYRLTTAGPTIDMGTGTNELIRHLFLLIVLASHFGFDPAPYALAILALHSVSMLCFCKMPWLLRSMARTIPTIALVNLALMAAWWSPKAAPFVAVAFGATYLFSVVVGPVQWARAKGHGSQVAM